MNLHTKKISPVQRLKKQGLRRNMIQLAASLLTNAQLSGYWTGRIYQGPLKNACVPGLNCYSCPGAIGACPIGALQSSLYDANQLFPFYVLSFFILIGSLLGRAVCGFLCPFGFLQDLLSKIVPKKKQLRLEKKLPLFDKGLRYLKFFNLVVLVILLPFIGKWVHAFAAPWFCKLVCPAGTVGGGWPLMILIPDLRRLAGLLFSWKTALAIVVLALCLFIPRFFCRYMCPLGAFYGLFNRFTLYRLRYDKRACIHCGACERVCPMGIQMPEQNESIECIRCGSCAAACPKDCLSCGFKTVVPSETELTAGRRLQ